MKLSKIISLCKSSKYMQIEYDHMNKIQYISDGQAIYFVEGIPELNENNVCQLYGINKDKIRIDTFEEEVSELIEGTGIELDDVFYSFELDFKDCRIAIFKGDKGSYCINKIHLSPFVDNTDYLKFEYQYGYVAVKEGLIKKAVIPVINIASNSLLTELHTLLDDFNKNVKGN